jgi:hypothetical protein
MNKTFKRLADSETKFFASTFFAPVFTDKVRVKIEEVFVDFGVTPKNYKGWGIFKLAGKKQAVFQREANIAEIAAYLGNFARTSFIVCDNDRLPLGISASEDKLYTTNLTPFFLANNISLFETVYVRFDGANFIFERPDLRSIRRAEELRKALENNVKQDKLDITGLGKFEKIAYALVYKLREEKKRLSTEGRLRSSVQKGGGQFHSYRRFGGNISVTYSVDGQSYTSTVSENFGVVSAGICLSGTDRQHDLQSLMTVIKEGQERGLIYRF